MDIHCAHCGARLEIGPLKSRALTLPPGIPIPVGVGQCGTCEWITVHQALGELVSFTCASPDTMRALGPKALEEGM